MTMIAIDRIRADIQAQPRSSIMMDTVSDYIERMTEGDEFPPLTVFHDGAVYWLGDGFHRYHAAVGCGLAEFPCDIREGGLREAILHSVGANATHGLRRTNEDKRRAVMKLLSDPEWLQWSDREIARQCGVSNRFVSNLRPTPSVNNTQIERKVTRNGTTYTQNTGNIGGSSRSHSPPPPPPAPPSNPKIDEINRNAWIGTHLDDVLSTIGQFPAPREAAEKRTPGMRYSMKPEQFESAGRWLVAYAEAWRRLDEQENANVAAE